MKEIIQCTIKAGQEARAFRLMKDEAGDYRIERFDAITGFQTARFAVYSDYDAITKFFDEMKHHGCLIALK